MPKVSPQIQNREALKGMVVFNGGITQTVKNHHAFSLGLEGNFPNLVTHLF